VKGWRACRYTTAGTYFERGLAMKRSVIFLALSAACALAGCASNGSFSTQAANDLVTPTTEVTPSSVAVRTVPNPNFDIRDNIATGVNSDIALMGSDTYAYENNLSYNDRAYSTGGNDFAASGRVSDNSVATDTHVSGSVDNGTVRSSTTVLPADNRTASDLAQPNPATDRPGDTTQLKSGNQKTDLNAMVAERDRNFVLDAASGGIYEVSAGEKAVAKSSAANVKALGQHMIDDHSKSNKELIALAERKGIHVATVPDADKIALLGKLDGLNGSDFDREYLKQQQQAHQDTIAKFEAAANSAADKDIRDWAAATLPKLRDHLAMINSDLTGLGNTNIGSEQP